MDVIINALEQGLLFSIVAIAVYITYKIIRFSRSCQLMVHFLWELLFQQSY